MADALPAMAIRPRATQRGKHGDCDSQFTYQTKGSSERPIGASQTPIVSRVLRFIF
jgi:hypothetical protein